MNNNSQEISLRAYDKIWLEIIEKLIKKYSDERIDIDIKENAKEIVWDNYTQFREHCRETYMKENNGRLDRHKVCACMIYSIIKSSIISENNPKDNKKKVFDTVNEDLALTTGLSLLRAFVESAIRQSELSEEEKQTNLKKFDEGFKYPKSFHGNYRDNFLVELYLTKKEKNYNILALAHTLFLLETYTRYI